METAIVVVVVTFALAWLVHALADAASGKSKGCAGCARRAACPTEARGCDAGERQADTSG